MRKLLLAGVAGIIVAAICIGASRPDQYSNCKQKCDTDYKACVDTTYKATKEAGPALRKECRKVKRNCDGKCGGE